MITKQENYAMYLRKSRADIDLENKTAINVLKNHETNLSSLAASLSINIEEENIYREVVSGETINDRPVMQELLKNIKEHKFKGILVMEIERLARGNTIDQGVIAEAFQYSNTLIITPTKTYDPNNEFDEEYFEFGLFMSRREYKTINRRIQRGRVDNTKKGLYVGSITPFGYTKEKIKGGKGYKLIIKQNEAKIIKQIFNLYLDENLGTTKIANFLNQINLKTKNNNNWTAASVRNILTSQTIKGYLSWNKRQTKKIIINGSITTSRPISNNCIIVKGLHTPVITEKRWHEANQKLKSTSKPNQHKPLKNPLAGLIFCQKCSSKMVRKKIGTYPPIIICPNKNCTVKSTSLELVENRIIHSLINCKQLTNVIYPQYKYKKETFINKIIDTEIIKVNKQITTSYDLVEQGIYTKEIFTNRINLLKQKINDLNNEKNNIINNKNKTTTDIPNIKMILKNIHDIPNIEIQKQLYNMFISKVTYLKDSTIKDKFTLTIYSRFCTKI